jgi:hypothetical protein
MQAQGLTYIHEFGGITTITVTAKAMYYRAKRIIVGWLWVRSRMVWILLEFVIAGIAPCVCGTTAPNSPAITGTIRIAFNVFGIITLLYPCS